ncbi:hypothetical protein VTH82DRAFT_2947 [Thermothelomyces myriococcoides]
MPSSTRRQGLVVRHEAAPDLSTHKNVVGCVALLAQQRPARFLQKTDGFSLGRVTEAHLGHLGVRKA